MRKRRRSTQEPRPISGAQAKTTEEVGEQPATTEQRHRHDIPPADAPTQQHESYLPGSRAREIAETEERLGVLALIWNVFREGLRLSNLVSSYGRKPLIMVTFLSMIGVFSSRIFTIALPEIQRDLQVNVTFIITLAAWMGLVGNLLAVPFGYLGDRIKRVPLFGIGNAIASIGHVITGSATGKGGLTVGRVTDTMGGLGPQSVGFSLISDYVPPQHRGQAYAFRFAAYQIVAIVAPLLGGVVATIYTWRVPYIGFGVLGFLAALYFLRMPEPVRGYHERKAFGADEEVALRQQEPPSMGEALRAAWGVRTLRRYSYALPFEELGNLGFSIFYLFFLARTLNVDILGRGILLSLSGLAGLIGVVIGGRLTDRIMARNPGRVVIMHGAANLIAAIGFGGVAFAPNMTAVAVIAFPLYFGLAIVQPARYAVTSMVIPPRLRNLGLATLDLWTIPVWLVFPIAAAIAGGLGFRGAILFFAPFSIIGALIIMSAGPYVEFDIRSAASASLASEEWRKARLEGRSKLLVLRDVDVHYESSQVLFGVDLDVQEGEMIALLGTNGAGKSTLLRAISGTQQATGGAIVFDGRDTTFVPPYEISGYGIAVTPGGRGIFPGLTVRENMQLAGWLYGQDPKHAADLDQVYSYFPILRERLDQKAGSLSGGEQQMLALAQAFLSRPKLLMIDELSLGLSPAIVAQLLEIVRAIHARGTTIIIVEQSVNVALTLAKRAIFMEKGEIRFDGPTDELLARPDILRAVFLKGSSSLGAKIVEPTKMRDEDRANILEVRGLTKSYGGVKAVDDVTFALREHETLGLIGPNGAGKTTVLEIISGFNDPDEGQIVFLDRDVTLMAPDERAKLGLVRRFQDAKLFPSLTVVETIAIAFEKQVEVKSMVLQGLGAPQAVQSERRIRRKVDTLIELLGLEAYQDKFISEVSTGTRRIVDLACVLATEPRVLLLDEPSSGLAQREAENMAPLLQQVRRETGCSILIIEHDMPLISAVSDELLAMDLGRVVTRGTPDDVLNDERVVQAYLGTSEETIRRSGRSD